MDREKYTIASGDDETPVYELDAPKDGPTAVVVGGLHGNEVTGWEAAELIRCWTIDRGKIVVIPKACRQAIERKHRNHPDGTNMNRVFPSGKMPTHRVGKAIWSEITRHNPDYVFDLHRSKGLYQRSPSGVGMAIFPTPNARDSAKSALSHLNGDHIPGDVLSTHKFRIGNSQSGHNPLLSHKVGGDMTEAQGWLVETTHYEQDVYTQRDQLEHAVETLLYHGENGRIKVEDYGHDEQDPYTDVLNGYGESYGSPQKPPENGKDGDQELTPQQEVAKQIVDFIRETFDIPD